MKKSIFFLLAVALVGAFSCKRTDEVNPVLHNAEQPNDSLKIQNTFLPSIVIAGVYDQRGYVDGSGSKARFNRPMGIFTRSDGSLLIADHDNQAIRRISPTKLGTDLVVSTPYNTIFKPNPYFNPFMPADVAAIADGSVGVVGDYGVVVFSHGTHVSGRYDFECPLCGYAGIDKNPESTFFWYGMYEVHVGYDAFSSWLNSIDALETDVRPAIPISRTELDEDPSAIRFVSFSIAANDNKFLVTSTKVFEKTHSGALFLISSGFLGLTSIIANRDGSKLYVADQGSIKLITRSATVKPTITLLVKGADAYGLALSNNEKDLYFTSRLHHTVNRVQLP